MLFQMGEIAAGRLDLKKELLRDGILPKVPKAKKPSNKANYYVNVQNAFDIETTRLDLSKDPNEHDYHAFMYIWQWQLGEHTIIGRSWDGFECLVSMLANSLYEISEDEGLPEVPHLVCWIHNAAHEFAFLSGIYPFKPEEGFYREVRKPIYFEMYRCIEFRCSYLQTNMSLKKLTKQYDVQEKLSGQKFDYEKIRFPWTELSDYELQYCITDVQSLVEVMRIRMEKDGDNLQTIPLTSTGYVRRDVRNALKPLYLQIRDILPDEDQYRLLRRAFRGGNTHANKAHANKILKDVYSYDMASCYPAQQLTKQYPMSKFRWLDDRLTLDRIIRFLKLNYAVVGLYEFTNLRLKDKKTAIPYLSLSRTESFDFEYPDDKKKRKESYGIDNGRILYAKFSRMALTEIDLEIVLQQYDYDEIAVKSAMVAQKGFLPEEYKEVIRKYYHNKTYLKGTLDPDEQYLYQKDKEKLNAIYGMSAQDPIHADVEYDDGVWTVSGYDRPKEEIEKTLIKAKFPYQWGVYTTAYARQALQEGIDLAGTNMVYCDTDSIKTLGPVDVERINKKRRQLAKIYGGVEADRKGVDHYIGIFEYEGKYDRFVTCGAKRYAYEQDGHMNITVAGVTKQINEETGIPFAVEELGSLENFREGMKWEKAGGVAAVYNDFDDFMYTDPESGKQLHIGKNVALVPSTYEMTFTKDYKKLLFEMDLYGEYKDKRE